MTTSYASARYRVGFCYGMVDDRSLVTKAFDELLDGLIEMMGTIQLLQKGMMYGGGTVEALRQVKRRPTKKVIDIAAQASDAEQLGVYVFDALTAATAPMFLRICITLRLLSWGSLCCRLSTAVA